MDASERKRNPLIKSPLGGRALSALHLPFFLIRPPRGYGVLTTTGRRTGKRRRRCIRAIRRGNRVFVVAIRGAERSGWAKNLRANPEVDLRLRGGRFKGVGRELRAGEESEQAREAYGESVHPFEYLEHLVWRPGRPTAASIRELHRDWFERGTPLVVELSRY